MRGELVRDILWGFLFLLLQLAVFRHLSIFSMQIDAVLIYCLFQINRRDRTTAILTCAFFGLMQDAFLDLWGLNLFAKTLTAYILTFFVRATEEVRMPTIQVFLAVFLASILHNLVFLSVAYFSESYAVQVLFWQHLFGSSFYTAVVATLLHLFHRY
jgi:rod shape-determining protein MreD